MREILKKLFPFLLMLIMTPFYIFFDKLLLVDVFGCGCVPSAQTNLLNINFNANDLRLVAYSIMTILIVFLGINISRSFKQKWVRVAYCIAIFVVNSAIAVYVNKVFMWA